MWKEILHLVLKHKIMDIATMWYTFSMRDQHLFIESGQQKTLSHVERFFHRRAEQAAAICVWEGVLQRLVNGPIPLAFEDRQRVCDVPLAELRKAFPDLSEACVSALEAAWLTASGHALRAQTELRVLGARCGCTIDNPLVLGKALFEDQVGGSPQAQVSLARDGFFWHLEFVSKKDYERFVAAQEMVGGDGTDGCVIPYQAVSDGGWPIRLIVTQLEDEDRENTYRHERTHAVHGVIGHAFVRWEPEISGVVSWYQQQVRRCKDELLAWIVDGSSASVIEFHLAEIEGYEHLYAGVTEEERKLLKGLMVAACQELELHPAMQTSQASVRERLWAELIDIPLERIPQYLRTYNRMRS